MAFTGTVKWFNSGKGYGFIVPNSPEEVPGLTKGRDVYVHSSGVASGVGGLADGQKVTFEVEQTPRGPKAVEVCTPAWERRQADQEEEKRAAATPSNRFEWLPIRLEEAREAISKAERILESFSGAQKEEAARALRGAAKRLKYAGCPESTFSKRGKSPSKWKLAGAALRYAEEAVTWASKAVETPQRELPIRAVIRSTYDWRRGRVTAEIDGGTTVTIPLDSLDQVPEKEEALYRRVVEIQDLDFSGDPDKGNPRVVRARLLEEVIPAPSPGRRPDYNRSRGPLFDPYYPGGQWDD